MLTVCNSVMRSQTVLVFWLWLASFGPRFLSPSRKCHLYRFITLSKLSTNKREGWLGPSINLTAARLRLYGLRDLISLRNDTFTDLEKTMEMENLSYEARKKIFFWMSLEGAGMDHLNLNVYHSALTSSSSLASCNLASGSDRKREWRSRLNLLMTPVLRHFMTGLAEQLTQFATARLPPVYDTPTDRTQSPSFDFVVGLQLSASLIFEEIEPTINKVLRELEIFLESQPREEKPIEMEAWIQGVLEPNLARCLANIKAETTKKMDDERSSQGASGSGVNRDVDRDGRDGSGILKSADAEEGRNNAGGNE